MLLYIMTKQISNKFKKIYTQYVVAGTGVYGWLALYIVCELQKNKCKK